MMDVFDRIVEEKILAAMRSGEFDHLKGKGKPLNLQENPFEPLESRLCNHLLHQNNCLYPWMETALEIEQLIKTLRENYRLYFSQCNSSQLQPLEKEFFEEIKIINRKIMDYNLQVPSGVFQKTTLQIESELERIRKNL